MTAAITLEGDRIRVLGSDFGDGGKLELEVHERADNGDSRSAMYRLAIAGSDHPRFPVGTIDWDEPLTFDTGTVEIVLRAAGEVVTEEVFHLGG